MPITINGSGTVTGISAGGLPDGVITTDDIAANAVTPAKLATTVVGPSFRAYSTTSQSISGNTATKILFNAKTYDTNGCFDATTNYRFTPNVAGYYQINAVVYFQGSAGAYTNIVPCKNGNSYANINVQRSNGNYNAVVWSDVVYFNGTSDYFEIYAYDNATCSTNTGGGASHFSGALVRPA
jgi:hypothetical protein